MLTKETRNKINELNLSPGDTVLWQGANRVVRGTVESSGDALSVRTQDGHTFRLEDVVTSLSFKKEEKL